MVCFKCHGRASKGPNICYRCFQLVQKQDDRQERDTYINFVQAKRMMAERSRLYIG